MDTQDNKYIAIVEQYIIDDTAKKEAAGKEGYGIGRKQKLMNYLPMSLKFFDKRDILSPSESDFDMLADFLKNQRDKKGKLPSPATVKDRVNLARNFYKFYNRYNPKKGDTQMSIINPYNDNNTITETQEAQASEIINPEVEISTHEQEAEAELLPAQEKEDEDKAISGATKGRKNKPAEDRRSEKLYIYLTPTLYEDMKYLARYSNREISDIIFTLASEFVERNRTNLEAFKNFLKNTGTINI